MHSKLTIQQATLAAGRLMIQENMLESDQWLYRGLVAIFERQTADEQDSEHTKEDNGVGFSGTDAAILTSFAKQVIAFNSGRSRFRYPLSLRQKATCQKLMRKYSGQLMRIVRADYDRQNREGEDENIVLELQEAN